MVLFAEQLASIDKRLAAIEAKLEILSRNAATAGDVKALGLSLYEILQILDPANHPPIALASVEPLRDWLRRRNRVLAAVPVTMSPPIAPELAAAIRAKGPGPLRPKMPPDTGGIVRYGPPYVRPWFAAFLAALKRP